MKIGLHSNQLSVRGTEVAIWDYAQGLRSRGHTIRVFAEAFSRNNEPQVIQRFQEEFDTVLYESWDHVLEFPDIDFLYMIKSGERDEKIPAPGVRHGVHVVFMNHDPHGDVYAYISRWLSNRMSRGRLPYVPHIVSLPVAQADLREELGIPESATVFGRHGGHDTFNIPWVRSTVLRVLEMHENAWFVFLNTDSFVNHERVVHLEATPDRQRKAEFINTCDAMLHARASGETFGLACAEFSLANKPVITFALSPEQAHIEMLGQKALLYASEDELLRLLLSFEPRPELDWNAYRDYAEEPVMDMFEEVFLGGL
ncbi:MAG: glycosyltransferase family 1 protein [Coriobacteriia bacterium]